MKSILNSGRESYRPNLKRYLKARGFQAVPDEDLQQWVINSTEWPHALMGGFDQRFLHLPREILVTVMRDHQKYFAVENDCRGAPTEFHHGHQSERAIPQD